MTKAHFNSEEVLVLVTETDRSIDCIHLIHHAAYISIAILPILESNPVITNFTIEHEVLVFTNENFTHHARLENSGKSILFNRIIIVSVREDCSAANKDTGIFVFKNRETTADVRRNVPERSWVVSLLDIAVNFSFIVEADESCTESPGEVLCRRSVGQAKANGKAIKAVLGFNAIVRVIVGLRLRGNPVHICSDVHAQEALGNCSSPVIATVGLAHNASIIADSVAAKTGSDVEAEARNSVTESETAKLFVICMRSLRNIKGREERTERDNAKLVNRFNVEELAVCKQVREVEQEVRVVSGGHVAVSVIGLAMQDSIELSSSRFLRNIRLHKRNRRREAFRSSSLFFLLLELLFAIGRSRCSRFRSFLCKCDTEANEANAKHRF